MNKVLALFLIGLFISFFVNAQVDKSDWQSEFPEGCTSITVGKNASTDGSVMTSHTDDSHRTCSWIDIQPAKKHEKGSTVPMYKRVAYDSLAMPTYAHNQVGEIPQIKSTFGFINTAYPCMNEKQLAIGESTFGGRDVLQSDAGIIDCQRLCQLMLERCTTARDAIKLAEALEKAIIAVPDSMNNKNFRSNCTVGEMKEWFKELIDFFREGEFQIT